MKKIIVTGGSGFIGSNVVNLLTNKKFQVIVLDKKKPNFRTKFIRSDLKDLKQLIKVTKNIDCIFHFAGVSDINKVGKAPLKTITDNVLLTNNLLEACRKNRIKRFIFASSIYTKSSLGNLYTTSKVAAEKIIKDYSLLFKLKYTILRIATVYGTNNRGADVISLFIKKAIKNKNIIVHNNGLQTRDFIHAKDLASGLLVSMKKKYENKTFIVGSKKKTKIKDLAHIIKKLTKSNSRIIINRKLKRFDDFDLNKVNNLNKNNYLNFKKHFNLQKGIEKTLLEIK